jgi:hypothetical protein
MFFFLSQLVTSAPAHPATPRYRACDRRDVLAVVVLAAWALVAVAAVVLTL